MSQRLAVALTSILLTSQANTGQLPLGLTKSAGDNNCAPVTGFYDRPGMVEPPFVYGFLSGEREDNAVFWCEFDEGDDKYYRLVITHSERQDFGCPTTIDTRAFPGG
ncbi:MAG: hypothetical protein AAFY56_17670 [Pseudomonadota bacterium]